MKTILALFGRTMPAKPFDLYVIDLMRKYGKVSLRVSLAVIFIWFGGLKLFDSSPANELITKTVFWFPSHLFLPFLAIWEVAIGVGLLIRRYNKLALVLLFLQMGGTLLPLLVLPEQCFTTFPFGLTITGQYIVKNIVFISAAMVIAGRVEHCSCEEEIL